jgi:two-component system NtrC family sensor kinase
MTAVGVGVIGLISLLVLLLMRNELHRPIRALVRTLDALARRDYSARFEGTESAELGYVGEAINRMAHELERANAELHRWAQTLERRVDEKTAELEIAQERVIRVDRMAALGKLAAVVAHEINNPLASVLTYSRLLIRRAANKTGGLVVDDDTRRILDAIASESARCGEIVSNLLLFTREGRGAQPTNLDEVTKRVLFLLKHKMDLAKVSVTTELAEDLPALECDPGQIEQALLALCMNAIEAMPRGGTITIRTALVQPAAVELSIRDTGMGIPPEVLPHIFEPFYTTKAEGEGKGIGLGLAVVDGIVTRHHAQITVASVAGQGTVFTLTFPLPAPLPAAAPAVGVEGPS